MKVTKSLPLVLSGALLVFALGCEKKEGPAEQAGKQIDKGLGQIGDQMKDAGEKVKNKAEGY